MAVASGERAPRLGRIAEVLTVPALSWALYDFANTIFSYAVLTRYFNEWIVIQQDTDDFWLGIMSLVVSLFLVASLPFFGALSDRLARRKPFLVAFTLLAVAATGALGFVSGVAQALVVAGVAIFGFQSALAQYDPLLARVAPPDRRGTVSGMGVGMGYVGVLVALFLLGALVPEGQNQKAFLPTAGLFLLFALPCFLFVREGEGRRLGRDELRGTPGEAFREVWHGLRALRGDVGRFLLARFLYVDAIATVIAFMTVYAVRVNRLEAGEVTGLLSTSILFAIVGAVTAGLLVERLGPKRVLVGILVLFSAALVAEGLTGSTLLLWVAGPIVGISLGGVWTSDRVFMLRLAPAEHRGELFGLYALAGKLSSGIGPLVLWGGTVYLLVRVLEVAGEAAASRVALCVLAAASLAGIWVLRSLDDAPRDAGAAPS